MMRLLKHALPMAFVFENVRGFQHKPCEGEDSPLEVLQKTMAPEYIVDHVSLDMNTFLPLVRKRTQQCITMITS
eukprot:6466819-Amphidinium_carterae.3